jgi:hypothetical protein
MAEYQEEKRQKDLGSGSWKGGMAEIAERNLLGQDQRPGLECIPMNPGVLALVKAVLSQDGKMLAMNAEIMKFCASPVFVQRSWK